MRSLSCQQALALPEGATTVEQSESNTAIPAVHLYRSIHQLPAEDWNELVQASGTFMQRDFLASLETANPDLSVRYALIYHGQQPVFCGYFQQLTFDVQQTVAYTELKEDATWRDKLSYRLVGQFKKLAERWKVTLLVGGNAFLSCEGSHAYSKALSDEQAQRYLLEVTEELAKRGKGISAILLKDFYRDATDDGGTDARTRFADRGFHPFQAEPNMVLDLKPEWQTFDDYLAAMSSKYRQRARSAYKKSKALRRELMSLEDMQAERERMYELFQEVVSGDKFALVEPSADYFLSLKREMGDRFHVHAYRRDGELIAFMTTIQQPTHLEAHFLGFAYELNHDLKLYQRMLYDMVQEALDRQLPRISFGRTALEIKSCVGATPAEMDIFLKLTNPLFNRLAGPIMKNVDMDPWQQRHPFK